MGADYAVTPDDLTTLLKEKNLVVDVACDFVGINSTFATALSAIRPCGMIVIVGLSSPKVDLSLLGMVASEATVKGSMWGTKKELQEVLKIVREGKVNPVVEARPMDKAVEAFEDLRNARLKGRVAVIPQH